MMAGDPPRYCDLPEYLIRFFLEIYHYFLEILRTFTGIFLRLLRSEYSFSVGGTILS
jgi:hypothetical protein